MTRDNPAAAPPRRDYGSRPHIEHGLRLDLRDIRRLGLLEGAGGCGMVPAVVNGQVINLCRAEVRLRSQVGWVEVREADCPGILGLPGLQRIELEATPAPLGGQRWWFFCGSARRRASVLYHFHGVEGFHCRAAFDPPPVYPCQRTSAGTHVYERIGAIHRRLGFSGAIFDIPPRPRHMRWTVYLVLVRKLFALWGSPDLPMNRFVGKYATESALDGYD